MFDSRMFNFLGYSGTIISFSLWFGFKMINSLRMARGWQFDPPPPPGRLGLIHSTFLLNVLLPLMPVVEENCVESLKFLLFCYFHLSHKNFLLNFEKIQLILLKWFTTQQQISTFGRQRLDSFYSKFEAELTKLTLIF